jgi:hexokinase
MKNEFKLNEHQLKEIAHDLKKKIEQGLSVDGEEILCLPTYIHPAAGKIEGQATALDFGGTNFRAAVVTFAEGGIEINPENADEKDLSAIRSQGFTENDLLSRLSEFVNEIPLPEKSPIGYCFSYPGKCLPNGDAELISWTKGVEIPEMVGKPVGKPLLDLLNQSGNAAFTGIKVINDTVASLFAGMVKSGYDAYIGLIVGTGTNMAAFIDAEKIPKLDKALNWQGLIPVNLESGNFNPPHLTKYDDCLDERSDNKGVHRFEKAVSGLYIGQLMRELFPEDGFNESFDAKAMSEILNFPEKNKKSHVKAARRIYKRSAKLVAASLAGLIDLLVSYDKSIKKVKITAEGSLFWSKAKSTRNYNKLVKRTLNDMMVDVGHKKVKIKIARIENSNLVGAGIAALS